jgi:hypothetical protein
VSTELFIQSLINTNFISNNATNQELEKAHNAANIYFKSLKEKVYNDNQVMPLVEAQATNIQIVDGIAKGFKMYLDSLPIGDAQNAFKNLTIQTTIEDVEKEGYFRRIYK